MTASPLFRGQLATVGMTNEAQLLPGDPATVIAEEITNQSIDVLVMGAYGQSRIRHLIIGSTTTNILRTCPIPVLLLR